MPRRFRPIWPVTLENPLGKNDKFDAYRYGGRSHAGIDIYKDKNTPVKASLDGKVLRASDHERHKSYGGLVIIDHTPDIPDPDKLPKELTEKHCYVYTLYAHLETAYSGYLGQMVRQGDVIGKVGRTGNAKGMKHHLHFETIRAKKRLKWNTYDNTGVQARRHRIDPITFFRGFSLPDEYFEDLIDTFHRPTGLFKVKSIRHEDFLN